MSDKHKHSQQATGSAAQDTQRPLRAHAVLMFAYGTASAGSLIAVRARGHELPDHIGLGDMFLIGVASHKLSRLIAKDRVTSPLRAPFTEFQQSSGHGEVEEQPRGEGMRRAIGELVVCPYCVAQWVATGLVISLVAAPRLTRLLSTAMVAHTISDFLQVAYKAAEERP